MSSPEIGLQKVNRIQDYKLKTVNKFQYNTLFVQDNFPYLKFFV